MKFSRHSRMMSASVVALVFAAMLPTFAQETAAPKQGNIVSVSLRDGTTVSGATDLKFLEVETVYGKLKVPIADVIHIRIGTNSMPDLKKRIEALIAQLGDNSFQKREAASNELAKLGALAASQLHEATKSPDPEVVTRAQTLLERLGARGETLREEDVLETKKFPIHGTVKLDGVTVSTERGAVKIEKQDMLSLTMTSGEALASLAHGLVAHWKFDENEGDIAHDSGPHRLHGKLMEYGATDKRWGEGRISNAVFFNGTTNYVHFPGSEEILNPRKRDWTFALWMKSTSVRPRGPTLNFTQCLTGKRERAGDEWSLEIQTRIRENPGTVVFFAGKPNVQPEALGRTNVCDGNWHHVVCIRTGKTLRIFVDGVLDGEITSDQIPEDIASSAPFQLGRFGHHDGWANPRFEGFLDDVRIYNRALTKEEISALAKDAK
jgi:hypothetical protein